MMLIKPNGNKLKTFLNFAVSIRSFEVSATVQKELVSSFVKLANDNIENMLFTYPQLLDYMTLFKGETALMFADLISVYSNRNPQFLTHSSYACYIFSKFAQNEHAWRTALSILTGQITTKFFLKQINIQRSVFTPVILEMLCALTSSHSNQELLQKVVNSLLSCNTFVPFSTENCKTIA